MNLGKVLDYGSLAGSALECAESIGTVCIHFKNMIQTISH